jgi:hypothetical protein
LHQQQYPDSDQPFETIDEIFSSLSADMTEDVLRNWTHRLAQVIALDGDHGQ